VAAPTVDDPAVSSNEVLPTQSSQATVVEPTAASIELSQTYVAAPKKRVWIFILFSIMF